MKNLGAGEEVATPDGAADQRSVDVGDQKVVADDLGAAADQKGVADDHLLGAAADQKTVGVGDPHAGAVGNLQGRQQCLGEFFKISFIVAWVASLMMVIKLHPALLRLCITMALA